jgi:glutamine amidotransferase
MGAGLRDGVTFYIECSMITIIDYGMGNLFSIRGALEYLGADCEVVSDPRRISKAEKIILPGVGSFCKAMDIIVERDIDKALREAVLSRKIPLLGICLGMQLLATEGAEGGPRAGLNFINATVHKIEPAISTCKIPHIGFNTVCFKSGKRMFEGVTSGADFYFIHSYRMVCMDDLTVAASTEHGLEFVSAVEKENIWGCQFHPEKSQKNGLRLLSNFIEL